MWVARGVAVVIGAGLLAGCAGGKNSQNMARLQSQVGLLEERVGQLERSSLTGTSSSGSSWIDTTSASIEPITTPVKKRASSASSSASKSSIKPSTREIQQALKNAGFYTGTVDGKIGPKTREAIKEFQRVHGLVDDGVVGKQTWAKLQAYADLSGNTAALSAAETIK